MDEPTNGLDPAGIREFREHLRKISREQGVAVFVSSHLLSEMELMCDRIAVIQNGKLIDVRNMDGQTSTVYSIEATPLHVLERLLMNEGIGMTVKGETSEAVITKEQMPAIIKAAVEQDVSIFNVSPVQKTLEDQFLEMTGGGAIAETTTK